jgi:ArsR family transcriptional regulator, virulence genes transcriptional regulator
MADSLRLLVAVRRYNIRYYQYTILTDIETGDIETGSRSMAQDAQTITADDLREHAAEAADLLRAMSNPARLMVLCLLAGGEMSVGEMNQSIDLSQSALSQHLGVLRKEGLVATRRNAQTIYYSIANPSALSVLEVLRGIYCPTDDCA